MTPSASPGSGRAPRVPPPTSRMSGPTASQMSSNCASAGTTSAGSPCAAAAKEGLSASRPFIPIASIDAMASAARSSRFPHEVSKVRAAGRTGSHQSSDRSSASVIPSPMSAAIRSRREPASRGGRPPGKSSSHQARMAASGTAAAVILFSIQLGARPNPHRWNRRAAGSEGSPATLPPPGGPGAGSTGRSASHPSPPRPRGTRAPLHRPSLRTGRELAPGEARLRSSASRIGASAPIASSPSSHGRHGAWSRTV